MQDGKVVGEAKNFRWQGAHIVCDINWEDSEDAKPDHVVGSADDERRRISETVETVYIGVDTDVVYVGGTVYGGGGGAR
jgi:hypothetical protein